MAWGIDQGLDLDKPNSLSDAEWEQFRVQHGTPFGYPDGHPVYRFWVEVGRPDVMKRQRTILRVLEPDVGVGGPEWRAQRAGVPSAMVNLHIYLLIKYETGVVYEVALAAN